MKKIIIIGGGIAGLAAGIYARKAGFETIIYEKHSISGGECTGWDRKGFHIDGCIHWLTGTKEGTKLHEIWKEVGALGDVEIYHADNFATVDYEGTTVILHRDLDVMKAHLIEISPEDQAEIENLCECIEAYDDFEMPSDKPLDLMNIFELMKFYYSMRKAALPMKRLGKYTASEYINKFKKPAIREAFKTVVKLEYSAYTLPFSLATFISGNGGRPAGGSRAFAKRMEETYISLGGTIRLGSEVTEIVIDNGIATGVTLANGQKEYADYIIPACDTHITFEKLLGGNYRDEKFDMRYNDAINYPVESCVYVAFAVDADVSDYPENYALQTEEFCFEEGKQTVLSLKHYCYEPSFAPEGKSIVVVYIQANYDWWKQKRENYTEYKAEKNRLASDICKRIELRFPELSDKVSILDVATPVTYERYCGAYKGAWMSFGVTPKGKQLMHDGRIKGIKNLFMAGQWLMPPGGLPTAVVTGKWAIQRICKQRSM